MRALDYCGRITNHFHQPQHAPLFLSGQRITLLSALTIVASWTIGVFVPTSDKPGKGDGVFKNIKVRRANAAGHLFGPLNGAGPTGV